MSKQVQRFRPFKTGKKTRKKHEHALKTIKRTQDFMSMSFFDRLLHLLKNNKI